MKISQRRVRLYQRLQQQVSDDAEYYWERFVRVGIDVYRSYHLECRLPRSAAFDSIDGDTVVLSYYYNGCGTEHFAMPVELLWSKDFDAQARAYHEAEAAKINAKALQNAKDAEESERRMFLKLKAKYE